MEEGRSSLPLSLPPPLHSSCRRRWGGPERGDPPTEWLGRHWYPRHLHQWLRASHVEVVERISLTKEHLWELWIKEKRANMQKITSPRGTSNSMESMWLNKTYYPPIKHVHTSITYMWRHKHINTKIRGLALPTKEKHSANCATITLHVLKFQHGHHSKNSHSADFESDFLGVVGGLLTEQNALLIWA